MLLRVIINFALPDCADFLKLFGRAYSLCQPPLAKGFRERRALIEAAIHIRAPRNLPALASRPCRMRFSFRFGIDCAGDLVCCFRQRPFHEMPREAKPVLTVVICQREGLRWREVRWGHRGGIRGVTPVIDWPCGKALICRPGGLYWGAGSDRSARVFGPVSDAIQAVCIGGDSARS
jgi:hypothetical protein